MLLNLENNYVKLGDASGFLDDEKIETSPVFRFVGGKYEF